MKDSKTDILSFSPSSAMLIRAQNEKKSKSLLVTLKERIIRLKIVTKAKLLVKVLVSLAIISVPILSPFDVFFTQLFKMKIY